VSTPATLTASPTLATNERLRRLIAEGRPILHLAFGEAGLPVPDEVIEALTRGASDNAYAPVAGSPAARAAAAGYLERRRLPCDPDQIVIAPGSKALLWALLSILPGDVILPRPSWVSYAAQAAIAGKRVWSVPIAADGAGGAPDPDALRQTLSRPAAEGAKPGVLVLTLPDNPTGTVAPAQTIERVAEIAHANGLIVISDEIYRDLAHAPDEVVSPAEYLPETTYVTNGLSKNMALGGWRVGFVRLPPGATGRATGEVLRALASEVWSSAPAPMLHVAAHVLSEPPEIVEHVARSRRLHRAATMAAHDSLLAAGVSCRPPSGGFYLYPDLEPLRPALVPRGVAGADALSDHLLERYDIGVLSGVAFGDDPGALRFRMATSLLYGDTVERRRQALTAEDPTALPWIRESLDRIASAFRALAS